MKYFSILVLSLFVTVSFAQKPSDLVDVKKINSDFVLDLRYATNNNFLGEKVYPQARCFLRYEAAVQLNSVQKELESIGLGLKIFDGYRPLEVQRKMWEVMPDSRYVANPYKNGSRHNRGAAVDVSLVDSAGTELNMPTDFDDFSEKARQDYMNLPAEQRRNRWILRTVMEKHGFKPISSEWWHYDLEGWQKYGIVDVPLDSLYHTDFFYPMDH